VAQVIVFLALLFSIVIAVFAVQNTTPVSVSFLIFGPANVAVAVLVLISAALGALAMLLLGIAREARLRWRQRAIAQQLKTAQARVAQLEKAQAPLATSDAVTIPESTAAAQPSA
jgi:putative membrane protein